VHTGHAVITLGNGTTLTASNLDIIPKTSVADLYEFKYVSKPTDVQLAELVHLFEIIELPVGLINNPAQRENGVEQLLKKAQEVATLAVKAASNANFPNFTHSMPSDL
ncbi:MAG: hypothetical protein KAZ49_02020, partial [Proteocatella sp.]|nr:hypothetical protein [Proteocatella sp.]